jgi:hypothetical protein
MPIDTDTRRRYIIFDGPAYDVVKDTSESSDWRWERFDYSLEHFQELNRRPSPFLSSQETNSYGAVSMDTTAEQPGLDDHATTSSDAGSRVPVEEQTDNAIAMPRK